MCILIQDGPQGRLLTFSTPRRPRRVAEGGNPCATSRGSRCSPRYSLQHPKSPTLTLRAGRLIQCTLEEPSLSSKTASVGDPVLCYLRSAREFGRSAFPRGSYLAGRFSDAKDPGRIAGKGWLKLEFDRLIFPDTDIPISAKVIAVRRFRVDEEGKIIGQGHPKREAVAWFVPILWPIDLVRL